MRISSRIVQYLPCVLLLLPGACRSVYAQSVYDFGKVQIGKSKTVTVTYFFFTTPHGGTGVVTSDGITGSAEFTKSNDNILGSHPDGSTATIDFTFKPTVRGFATAVYGGSAYVLYNGQRFPGFLGSLTLEGTGVPEFGTGPLLCALGCSAIALGIKRRKRIVSAA